MEGSSIAGLELLLVIGLFGGLLYMQSQSAKRNRDEPPQADKDSGQDQDRS